MGRFRWKATRRFPKLASGEGSSFIQLKSNESGAISTWSISVDQESEATTLLEAQTVSTDSDGNKLVNGKKQGEPIDPDNPEAGKHDLHPIGWVSKLPDGTQESGELGPTEFLQHIAGERSRPVA